MEMLCCIKECDRPVCALGMCVNHWRMTVKHGSPVAERPLSAVNRGLSDEQRFWKSVERTDDCWLWRAGRDHDGYGIFRAEIYGIPVFRAHRYSHMLATGEILSPEVLVLHSCDNPPCCNPGHLSSGTNLENMADMVAKGRHLDRIRVHADKVAKLSADEVRAILRDPRAYAEIATEYSVHPKTVSAIKNRATRQHVEIDPSEIVHAKRGARGAAKSKLLTDDAVQSIRISEARTSVLAREYGVSPQTISDIRKLRSWKHLSPPDFVTITRPPFAAVQETTADIVKVARPANVQLCSVSGCEKSAKSRGLCQTHYMRLRRTGDAGIAEHLPKNGPKGATHHKSALTEAQAREILASAEKGVVLAARYGVKPAVISSIRHGHTWKHLQPEIVH